jgi:hypothetical protein
VRLRHPPSVTKRPRSPHARPRFTSRSHDPAVPISSLCMCECACMHLPARVHDTLQYAHSSQIHPHTCTHTCSTHLRSAFPLSQDTPRLFWPSGTEGYLAKVRWRQRVPWGTAEWRQLGLQGIQCHGCQRFPRSRAARDVT